MTCQSQVWYVYADACLYRHSRHGHVRTRGGLSVHGRILFMHVYKNDRYTSAHDVQVYKSSKHAEVYVHMYVDSLGEQVAMYVCISCLFICIVRWKWASTPNMAHSL